jgi:hypothetical protein
MVLSRCWDMGDVIFSVSMFEGFIILGAIVWIPTILLSIPFALAFRVRTMFALVIAIALCVSVLCVTQYKNDRDFSPLTCRIDS